MIHQSFDYEDVCMGVRDKKPKTYRLSFADDYRLRSLTQSVKLGKGRLLDIGCGGGRIAEALPYYYPEGHIYGCDVSASGIAFAKKFGSGKVRYSHISKKSFPYKNKTFDVAICLDVLEHVPDIHYFLKEVKRVLKKNGTFFLIVPCEGQPCTYTWAFQKLRLGDTLTFRYFGHIHPEFTHKNIQALLKKHGFTIKKVAYSEHVFYQLLHLGIFFLPKVMLEKFFGVKKAHEYANSSLLRSPKANSSPLMMIRRVWFAVFLFMMMYPMSWETVLLRRFSPTAWKLHVSASS